MFRFLETLIGFQLCASTLLVETSISRLKSPCLPLFPIMRLHIVSGDLKFPRKDFNSISFQLCASTLLVETDYANARRGGDTRFQLCASTLLVETLDKCFHPGR